MKTEPNTIAGFGCKENSPWRTATGPRLSLYEFAFQDEDGPVKQLVIFLLTTLSVVSLPSSLWAAGSGLNVALVVNQTSTNSVQLGNYYAEQRQLPPQNIVRINWTGGNAIWTRGQFETNLATPLRNTLTARGLTNQIDFVLLSMDIPYRVADTNGLNSTTSALFYGFKADTTPPPNTPDSCSLPDNSSNAYAGSEDLFRNVAPGSDTNTYLVTMITASNLAQARLIIDRGLASDATFPTQTVLLAKSSDPARNVRYSTFDNAVFNTRLRGNYSTQRIISDSPLGQTNLLGYQNGLYQFNISPNAFIPGAMADSLTSFGGIILEPNDQTTILKFLYAGATAGYGTVVEPCNYLQKFPSPQNYFYQARGFSLAECYYQSLTNPYQGLIVGEPLAAPFAQPACGMWINLPINALLTGTTNLSLQFAVSDAQHPLQQVDLFLDGVFRQTLTNILPRQGNVLSVTLPGRPPMNYTVQASETIKSVASGLAGVLNSPLNQNATKVQAFLHGDRIELQSFDPNKVGNQIPIAVSNSVGSASVLTTYVAASRSNFLDSIAWGIRSFNVAGTLVLGDVLQLDVTKTNGASVTVTVTNNSGSGAISGFVQQLANAINATPQLQGDDGLAAEDVTDGIAGSADFNLRARGIGYAASQIQATLTGTFLITPAGPQTLDENLSDLQPRNHFYISAGVTNLSLSFPLNTTPLADGYHELTAVVYEGSHVRTQKRITQTVRVQNMPLAATFMSLPGGSNIAVGATLQFTVTANTTNIARTELFSTGGLLATVSNQSTANFSVVGTNLDLGLHPFYALVTANDGKQYRTETKFIRLVVGDSSFPIQLTGPSPFLLSWPAIAGHSYDVLSANNITNTFQLRDTIVPTNVGTYQWIETNPNSPQRFYRVRVSP
ncbi:MAG: TIGR03790 family protein [Verrucomicrobia bacterium]|nr:TIGR03790 family protein [Verrucomicrobiota bacterium]